MTGYEIRRRFLDHFEKQFTKAIGVLMNARGLMELVILTIGLVLATLVVASALKPSPCR